MGWYPCPFNDGSFNKTLPENITIQAECMYLTSPLEWDQFNPNTFDGVYYNETKKISLTDLHMKRLFFSQLPPTKKFICETHDQLLACQWWRWFSIWNGNIWYINVKTNCFEQISYDLSSRHIQLCIYFNIEERE